MVSVVSVSRITKVSKDGEYHHMQVGRFNFGNSSVASLRNYGAEDCSVQAIDFGFGPVWIVTVSFFRSVCRSCKLGEAIDMSLTFRQNCDSARRSTGVVSRFPK